VTVTVYFVRHGRHDRLGKVLCGRMGGVTLSEDGVADARRAAERLKREGLAALYASPLERCLQTAEPIAQALALPARPDEDLMEVDYGEWTGAAFAELEPLPAWSAWNRERSSAIPPGGESMAQVQMRVGRFLNEAVRRHAGERIVAVTHGDVIKSALIGALGLPLDAHDRLEVSPGSLSIVVAGDWGAKVYSINEVPA
jgi:broad specificity phosphatase PhoE